eukprot:364034-Chlamydomonas_euryale.AAC.12
MEDGELLTFRNQQEEANMQKEGRNGERRGGQGMCRSYTVGKRGGRGTCGKEGREGNMWEGGERGEHVGRRDRRRIRRQAGVGVHTWLGCPHPSMQLPQGPCKRGLLTPAMLPAKPGGVPHKVLKLIRVVAVVVEG